MNDRRTAVYTAQPWYNLALDDGVTEHDRLSGALNAFNHTENALFALADKVVSCAGGAGDNELLEMAQRYCSDRKSPKTIPQNHLTVGTPTNGIMRHME